MTFLFSDIEGSTKVLRELGADAYASALMTHRLILREAAAGNGGVEVDTQGDAFFFAFPTAPGALRAAAAAQHGLASGPIRVRMGVHTGTPHVGAEGYVGEDVHKGARIAAAGHGGQVLVSAAAAALAGTDGLRDLGDHRLKDLSAPERVYQLGTVEFPPLRSLHQTNLPIPPTPFLGRERELAEVVALLAREDVRVITLTGPGGTGKTRLAMQAAAELSSRYAHGVWWVPLAAVRQPELVLETAARALGAKGGLAEHIGGRSMLVIFDNFEQVIGAAGGLADLLESCPHLELLVTSREPLRIRAEREYPVPPLGREDGSRLFVERAREHGREVGADRDVSEICARLDDLPLAIELAAARVKVLTPAEIRKRLDQRLPLLTGGARDLPERQRTLRAAIGWSYELLSAAEQRLFARLAVFRGGWTLEAAEAIADADLDLLQSLVEKSLVRHEDGRFWILATIGEYAAERLAASGEAEVLRRRHADHFLALAQDNERAVLGGDPRASLDLLERDHDNVRAAIEHLSSSGETELAMRLAWAVHEFWCLRGHVSEGWRRLEGLLRMDDRPTAARARALAAAAHLAPKAGTPAETERLLLERAIALNRSVGDEWTIAYVEHQLATSIADSGDFARAAPLIQRSVERFRALGDEHHALSASRSLAWATWGLGDAARARELYEDVVRRARAAGERRMEGVGLGPLAQLATADGRFRDALSLIREAYRIHTEIGVRSEISLAFTRLARVHAELGRAEAAAMLLGRSEALREEAGETDAAWVRRAKEEVLSTIRADLRPADVDAALERGRAMSTEEATALGFAPLDDPSRLVRPSLIDPSGQDARVS